MYKALTIAGSDSVGGAGIQADLKAFASLGVHGCCAITAITAQNTSAVDRIQDVGADMLRAQIDSVLDDVDIGAVKTGMLYTAENVYVVSEILDSRELPLVVDPVMVAGVGDSLSSDGLVEVMVKELMPLCDVVTPNLSEAEALSGMDILDEDDAMRACEIIGSNGCSVYLKGGHMDSEDVVDYLYQGAEFTRFRYPRLATAGHGGGCTLSAYITANLAKGRDVLGSIMSARDEIQSSILTMYDVGKGVKVVNPMVGLLRKAEGLEVLHRLRDVIGGLESLLPSDWVPQSGSNVVYALPAARTVGEVAALESRMMSIRGCTRSIGGVAFGTSLHMATVTLTAMRYDQEMRSSLNIRYDEELVNLMEELGLVVACFEGNHVPDGSTTALEWAVSNTIEACEEFPDVIYDHHGAGDAAMVRILGRNPEELLNKIKLLL